MANYLATDTDLTAVADAIRTKGGTSGQLAFPDGFVSAIEDISGGGGEDTLFKKLNNTLTSYDNSDLTSVPIGGFSYLLNNFKSLSLPNVVTVGQDAFRNNYLTSLYLPKLQSASGQSAFYQSFTIDKIVLPAWRGMTTNIQNTFSYCNLLEVVDLGPQQIGTLGNYTFFRSGNLATLILRSNTQIALNNVNAFNETKFASDSSGGTLYVPQALISSYQAATNWSTILGYANNSIQAIEGSIYETQYADGTLVT